MTKHPLSAGLLAGALTLLAAASLPAAPANAARYAMQPTKDGGFIRLDTETGAVSYCDSANGTVTCTPAKDPQMALQAENSRLRSELADLKSKVAEMEKFIWPDERDQPHRQGRRPHHVPELKLPTEEEVDKALTYLQRIFKKFQEKLKELETDKPPADDRKKTPL